MLTEAEIENVRMGRRLEFQRGGRPKGPIGLVKKALSPDVLYLAIVNLPSEGELREIQQSLGMASTETVN